MGVFTEGMRALELRAEKAERERNVLHTFALWVECESESGYIKSEATRMLEIAQRIRESTPA